MLAPAIALALVPEDLSAVEAAPLMCAGITTYNPLRNSNARPGDVVAVLGLGDLGHLGVQYAVKMGFKTVAIARGADKEALARKVGAQHYIDSQAQDPAVELQNLGGTKLILATVTNGDAMSAVKGGLGLNGTLLVIGAAQSLQVSPLGLISGRRSVKGWYSGTAIDSQDTLKFSVLTGVRSMNEVYPLEKVEEACERMMSGKARFRVVFTTGQWRRWGMRHTSHDSLFSAPSTPSWYCSVSPRPDSPTSARIVPWPKHRSRFDPAPVALIFMKNKYSAKRGQLLFALISAMLLLMERETGHGQTAPTAAGSPSHPGSNGRDGATLWEWEQRAYPLGYIPGGTRSQALETIQNSKGQGAVRKGIKALAATPPVSNLQGITRPGDRVIPSSDNSPDEEGGDNAIDQTPSKIT